MAHSLGSVIMYDILTAVHSSSIMTNAYGEDPNREKLIFNHFSENDSEILREYQACRARMQDIEVNLLKSDKNITTLEFKVSAYSIYIYSLFY